MIYVGEIAEELKTIAAWFEIPPTFLSSGEQPPATVEAGFRHLSLVRANEKVLSALLAKAEVEIPALLLAATALRLLGIAGRLLVLTAERRQDVSGDPELPVL